MSQGVGMTKSSQLDGLPRPHEAKAARGNEDREEGYAEKEI
jgi:hypothetical protein